MTAPSLSFQPAMGSATETVQLVNRQRRRRRNVVVGALAALVVALFVLALCVGDRTYSPAQVMQVLTGHRVRGVSFVVLNLRLPRAVTAVLAGAALGLVGTCFQALLRNTLASPDIIGITAGANTAAVAAIIVFGLSGLALTSVAVAGGLATALIVALLAWQGNGATSRLILVGIAVGAMFDAVTLWIMMLGDQWDIQAASRWLTGSLNGSTWDGLVPLGAAMLLGLPVLAALARHLDALRLGNDLATGLGVPVSVTRALVVTVGVVILSCAIATTGPISFVSLLCGPIATHLLGGGRLPLTVSALVGAALVLASDFTAQYLLPHVYPVGVVTGAVGGLYLLALIVRIGRGEPSVG